MTYVQAQKIHVGIQDKSSLGGPQRAKYAHGTRPKVQATPCSDHQLEKGFPQWRQQPFRGEGQEVGRGKDQGGEREALRQDRSTSDGGGLFKGHLRENLSLAQRRKCIHRSDTLSLRKQCELLGVSRSGLSYLPKGESPLNLQLMRLMDEEYLRHPFRGVPSMHQWLLSQGYHVNIKRVGRLYRLMGLQALVPGPHTSKANPKDRKMPYLLDGLEIVRPNQVWATDITYIPMPKGYMYLTAVVDLYSRCVLAWSLSNTMTAEWCAETLQEAIDNHEKPEIFNTDQGSQYTSEVFAGLLRYHGIRHSMDGKGRALDNIFVERLWRTVKYEHVYLNPASEPVELFTGLNEYLYFYNHERLHSSLGHKTPMETYKATIFLPPQQHKNNPVPEYGQGYINGSSVAALAYTPEQD